MPPEVGRILRELREERGWTREKLAGEAGVGFHTVYKAEQQGREPRLEHLVKLADALDVTLDRLAGREPKKRPPRAR